jgi:hypothetical protein
VKVLDLSCSQGHTFEGWFGSEEAFSRQLTAGQVECPFCADTAITKRLSAPRLNLGSGRNEPKQELVTTPDAALQAAWLKVAREVIANTEDVGERFAEEARRIHHGESEERGIRGQATRQEAEALREEGIGVLPLPIPKAAKETLQ